ncbi:2OG-Fe(II) oxygenase [Nannizzia gypsea CBS 118893]|uniref:2OG-Fe(II) oxygenase n=1 Tax=Arthroderma gypseum (strain ATCC MYA-4604 / CBS 118893) TaxID=535722 RepID=E4V333_ARTGP|nr:2OG-Fe(II) oxygenase [Nannizzia gypsea CBS 118893]EFR04407.1 2OG-Fe(II) oxygenase [Nannizzia gypsea CBS 118893]
MSQVPIIDSTPLFTSESFTSPECLTTISQIHSAFCTWGICVLTGTNSIPPELTKSLSTALNKFFALSSQKKEALHLKNGGWAWRGYMPWGGEGSKGNTDQKEGFYGGPELNPEEEHELKGLPTYGKNQFPDEDVPEMRYDAMSVGLGWDKGEMRKRLLEPEPIQLFRAFKYSKRDGVESCGIGEHSDFGFLTILSQDAPGLQVMSPSGEWTDVPVIPNSFVVNVGDILDRLTSGLYIAPLHRVLPPLPGSERLSIPFFFDPAWTAKIERFPLPNATSNTDPTKLKRWAQRSTFDSLQGIWGQYLGIKVQKIFPDLKLPEFSAVSRPSTRHLIEVKQV